MYTALCESYGIEVPIFAFSYSPAVVAAVSQAGGLGVLGATGWEPAQLSQALQWITQECEGKPYGIDLVLSAEAVGPAQAGRAPEDLEQEIPVGHRAFVEELLTTYQVPAVTDAAPVDLPARAGFAASPPETARLIEIALTSPIRLLVSALGSPPAALIERAHQQQVRVGTLVGTVKQAVKQKEAGLDLIIAQGYEAGGHTGEIANMVLVPQVVEAVAPIPVLCAGGSASGRQCAAAFALGAQGVWTGSVWLMTQEAATHPVLKDKFRQATSGDTLRSRAASGKPARLLRSGWTDAWEDPANPKPLPMPLQYLLSAQALERIEQDAVRGGAGGKTLLTYYVGQVVGMLNEVRPAAEVLRQMNEEADAVLKQMSQLLTRADASDRAT